MVLKTTDTKVFENHCFCSFSFDLKRIQTQVTGSSFHNTSQRYNLQCACEVSVTGVHCSDMIISEKAVF